MAAPNGAIWDLLHRLDYGFSDDVRGMDLQLCLLPTSRTGQTVTRARLSVLPPGGAVRAWIDAQGNRRHTLQLTQRLGRLTIAAASRVQLTAPPALPNGLRLADLPRSPAEPTRLVPGLPDATALARDCLAAPAPLRGGLKALLHRLQHRLAYRPGSTGTATTAAQAWAQQAGVCQDFAHILLAGLRGLGLEATYVCGYRPPAAADTGPVEPHAWVRLCLPGGGWQDLDPAFGELVTGPYLTLAVGADYDAVRPVAGRLTGASGVRLTSQIRLTPSAG